MYGEVSRDTFIIIFLKFGCFGMEQFIPKRVNSTPCLNVSVLHPNIITLRLCTDSCWHAGQFDLLHSTGAAVYNCPLTKTVPSSAVITHISVIHQCLSTQPCTIEREQFSKEKLVHYHDFSKWYVLFECFLYESESVIFISCSLAVNTSLSLPTCMIVLLQLL